MRTAGAVGKKNEDKLRKYYDFVCREPGITASMLARKMGLPYANIYNVLPSLEDLGLLLSEDEKGRLYPI